MTGFVPLHVKSHHSIGFGTASIAALVQHAGRVGLSSLALTDVETLHAQVQFHVACLANGLAPITGVELRPGFRPRQCLGAERGRVVLLAEDAMGYASLCQIVTRRRAGPTPVGSPLESLRGATAGLFVLTDDAALLRPLAAVVGPERVRALLIRPRAQGSASEQELISSARELGVAITADIDAELLEASDRELQLLARAVHLGRHIDAVTRSEDAATLRLLLAPGAAERLFADLPAALEESARVAAACRFDLLGWHLVSPGARQETAARHADLARRCRSSLRASSTAPRPAYLERLETELEAIRALGLTDLVSTISSVCDHARERAIPIAARGSAVSSLVLHSLGVSAIDPVQHGLMFERFVSRARRTPPDIDVDVASSRREELIEHAIRARGPECTARLASLATFGQKSAHREGLKAFGAPPDVIDAFLRAFPPDELEGHERWRISGARLRAPWRDRLGTIAALVGMPRHLSLHPGGIALSPAPLVAGLPLERTRSGVVVCQYDADSIARLGISKIDLLGSRCLDETEETWLSSLTCPAGDHTGAERLVAPPLDDMPTWKLIDEAQTVGCFQLESPAIRALLTSLPIRNLEHLTHALSLVRPGPASDQAKDSFIARARGEACVSMPGLPAQLSERLLATQGLLLYEEDVALMLSELTGVPLAEAEALRVRLGEREGDAEWLERARRRFMSAAAAQGLARESSAQAWSIITRFARYSFNKAHATSQALLAYRAAYCKAHAPVDFGRALLNHHGGSYPRRVIASELSRRGVRILAPCLIRSSQECTVETAPCQSHPAETAPTGRAIRIGLGLIKGLRAASGERLLARRSGAIAPEDFRALLRSSGLRPRELRGLVRSGACDEAFALESADYPWAHEAVLQLLEGERDEPLSAVIAAARAKIPTEPPALVERYRRLRRIQNELEWLEMHVSDHPMHVLRSEAERQGCVPSHRLREHVSEEVTFAGVIAAARSIPVAESDAAQFLTFEDEHGLVEARLAPANYDRLHAQITTPGPFLLQARVVERFGALHLSVRELLPFHQRAAASAARVERQFEGS